MDEKTKKICGENWPWLLLAMGAYGLCIFFSASGDRIRALAVVLPLALISICMLPAVIGMGFSSLEYEIVNKGRKKRKCK